MECHELRSRIYSLTHDDNNNAVVEEQRNNISSIKERLVEIGKNSTLLQRTITVLQVIS